MQRRSFKRPITAFLVLIKGPKFQDRIRRLGYYWPSMIKDCIDYPRRCDARQFHGDDIPQASNDHDGTVVITQWNFGVEFRAKVTLWSPVGTKVRWLILPVRAKFGLSLW